MPRHEHPTVQAILFGAFGTILVLHGMRILGAILVNRGGRAASVGKYMGGAASFPAAVQ